MITHADENIQLAPALLISQELQRFMQSAFKQNLIVFQCCIINCFANAHQAFFDAVNFNDHPHDFLFRKSCSNIPPCFQLSYSTRDPELDNQLSFCKTVDVNTHIANSTKTLFVT